MENKIEPIDQPILEEGEVEMEEGEVEIKVEISLPQSNFISQIDNEISNLFFFKFFVKNLVQFFPNFQNYFPSLLANLIDLYPTYQYSSFPFDSLLFSNHFSRVLLLFLQLIYNNNNNNNNNNNHNYKDNSKEICSKWISELFDLLQKLNNKNEFKKMQLIISLFFPFKKSLHFYCKLLNETDEKQKQISYSLKAYSSLIQIHFYINNIKTPFYSQFNIEKLEKNLLREEYISFNSSIQQLDKLTADLNILRLQNNSLSLNTKKRKRKGKGNQSLEADNDLILNEGDLLMQIVEVKRKYNYLQEILCYPFPNPDLSRDLLFSAKQKLNKSK